MLMMFSVPNPFSVSDDAFVDTVDDYLTCLGLKMRMRDLYRSLDEEDK